MNVPGLLHWEQIWSHPNWNSSIRSFQGWNTSWSGNVINDSNSYLLLNCNSNFERRQFSFGQPVEICEWYKIQFEVKRRQGRILIITAWYWLQIVSVAGKNCLKRKNWINCDALFCQRESCYMEDIKALCFEHFGSELSEVEIKKGVHLDHLRKRTCQVARYLPDSWQTKQINSGWSAAKDWRIKIRLKQESINLLPYRIFSVNYAD